MRSSHGSSDPSRLIRYLHDCHQADSREFAITSLFGRNVRHLLFLSGKEELLDGTLGRLAVNPEWAVPARKSSAVYRRERSLIYASFFLAGHEIPIDGRPRDLCAPLVFYPAEISHETLAGEPVSFVTVELSEQRFNVPILSALIDKAQTSEHALETLLSSLPEPPFDGRSIHDMVSLLDALFPQVDTTALYRYPRLVEEKDIRRMTRVASGDGIKSVQILPASAVALIDNPGETRGVLFELSALASSEKVGAPLRALLGAMSSSSEREMPEVPCNVPAILSAPQTMALKSAAVNELTLVIGPPGTGKSYTAAALALDHLYRGESVLFASRAQQALDVIANKLEAMLGESGFIIRGGRKEYLRDLKGHLEQILRGVLPLEDYSKEDSRPQLTRLAHLDRKLSDIESRLLERSDTEQSLGEIVLAGRPERWFPKAWYRLHRGYLEWQLSGARPYWELMAEYQRFLEVRVELLSRVLKMRMRMHLEKVLEEHRGELKRFLQALRARTSSKQERLFTELNMRVLFKAFPVWMAGLAGIHRVLPLEADLFDLVVVDEATQCDSASPLPALHRAKRAVVTGDPKQLRHVSFLSRRRQSDTADRHGLEEDERSAFDYRDKSLLDLVEESIETGRQVVSLDEHYRSKPQIIAFSNREFYRDALRIMTRYPGMNLERSIEVKYTGGRRESRGHNSGEARALVDEVARWVGRELRLEKNLCHSLGVLSPFRDQVEHIRDLVVDSVPLTAIEKHALRIGTPHGFQGEERDLMFISLVVDSDAGAATFRYLNRPDVFNVSVTRARDYQYLFCSLRPEDAPGGSLLQRYLQEATDGPTAGEGKVEKTRDAFLEEVHRALVEAGLRVWPAFAIAGLTVDLVVETKRGTIGIDLVGYPGRFAGSFPLERYRMLQRAGLRALPLPYSDWRRDPKSTLQALLSFGEVKP